METKNLLHDLATYTADRKDEAIRESKTALENLDRRLGILEAKVDAGWDKMDAAAREKARESLKAIRQQRNQAAEWYGSMKSSSGDAWEHMKKGFIDAYKTLGKAWEKSEKEFGGK